MPRTIISPKDYRELSLYPEKKDEIFARHGVPFCASLKRRAKSDGSLQIEWEEPNDR